MDTGDRVLTLDGREGTAYLIDGCGSTARYLVMFDEGDLLTPNPAPGDVPINGRTYSCDQLLFQD